MKLMTITQAAQAAGITPKMARHYEALGLLHPTHRSDAGYRMYGESDIRMLRIIGRARDLGFPLPSIARLLEAAREGEQDDVATELASRIRDLEQQQRQLGRLLDVLRSLPARDVVSLAPFDRPRCPAAMQEGDGSEQHALPRRVRGRSHRSRPETQHAPARNPLFTAWGSELPHTH